MAIFSQNTHPSIPQISAIFVDGIARNYFMDKRPKKAHFTKV